MKKNLRNKIQSLVIQRAAGKQLLIGALIVFLSISCSVDKHSSADTYTCPMHPTVISDRPGTCPVCGMNLVRKAQKAEEVKITKDLTSLIKSPNEVVITSIKTVKGVYKSQKAAVQAQGVVTYDTRYVYDIPARIGGRLEKVYLKYALQPVHKGQKVADIYSPELLTAQRELLYLVQNDKSNEELIHSAKSKLFLLGASEKQVEEIIARKEAVYTFSIFSQYDGYVINENKNVSTSSSTTAAASSPENMGGSSMGAANTTTATPVNPPSDTELIREGSYVATGQVLFKVVNTSAIRVELNVALSQASTVKAGDKILLDMGNGKMETAEVDFVQPFFSQGEEFIKIRVYVHHAQGLRIGQLVSGNIQFQTKETMWLPKETILDLGVDKIVFVKSSTLFKPVKISTGIRANGFVEIVQGISSTDEVAANAQYLVDSESFIKSN
ncbi:MAG: efflux RND transporter periplasmic adaptor subunit [Bacteroidetes bacterium]|nr:efflux RND transporter periplasmic adaptor subunit [Bacteroidota bacterium]